MIKISQRDKKWADNKIGRSNLRIGDYGCTITSIAMLSDYYGCYHDPSWMAKNLSFTPDGLIYWTSVNDKLCFKWKYRYKKYDEKIATQYTKDPDKAVLFEVQWGRARHWVIAIRRLYGSTWFIADPWTGWYGTTAKFNGITGMATFQK